MPKHFDWYIKVSSDDKLKTYRGNNSCRESVATYINNTVVYALEEKCKYCGVYHGIADFSAVAEKAQYEMGIDTYGTRNVRWLSAFLKEHYPTVTTSVQEDSSWDGSTKIIYVLTGDHWVVNAWWWAALYFRLYNCVENRAEGLGILIVRSDENNRDIWYRSTNKEEHIAAFERLIKGKELPLSRCKFVNGPCSNT